MARFWRIIRSTQKRSKAVTFKMCSSSAVILLIIISVPNNTPSGIRSCVYILQMRAGIAGPVVPDRSVSEFRVQKRSNNYSFHN